MGDGAGCSASAAASPLHHPVASLRIGGWGREGAERRGGGGGRKSVLDIYVQIQWEINEHHWLKKCCKVFGSQQEEGEKLN